MELKKDLEVKRDGVVGDWLDKIEEAQKRDKAFIKMGKRVARIYVGEETEKIPFNVLYSNTETLLPALYNKSPQPRISRRFKDADKTGKWVAEITRRVLSFHLASTNPTKDSPDTCFESAILNALVPGRGMVKFAFDASFQSSQEGGDDTPLELKEEGIRNSSIPWDKVCFGYADCWEDVPWVSFEHAMQQDEVEVNFGKELANSVSYSKLEESDSIESREVESGLPQDLAVVYEIWDKEKREVVFISPGYREGTLKVAPDPLALTGFYPFARPLLFKPHLDSLTSTPLYIMYEQQATELNDITTRINKITRALRVRGFYDSTIEGLDRLLESEDNTLVPASNVAAMQQGQTLEKAIWFMPLQELVGVLQQLYVNRTQVKNTIYEITGISDIMRGHTQASETLGAQQIKSQWGSLRLQKMQKLTNRFVRDNLQILAEIALTKLSRDTIKDITQIKLLTDMEKEELKGQIQMSAMQAQATGRPPVPPPPAILHLMDRPTWEDVEGVYKSDLLRGYTISTETDATIDAEAMEEKRQAGEFMNSMAQFLNGVGQAMAAGLLPFPAAKAMLLSLSRKFQFGLEVEEELEGMQPPAPPAPEPGKAERRKEEVQAVAIEGQMRELEASAKAKGIQLASQLSEMEYQIKVKGLQQKASLDDANFQLKMQGLSKKLQEAQAQAIVDSSVGVENASI